MPGFVPHEVEPTFAARNQGQQPDHLVQGQAPLNDRIGVILGHVPVHRLVHQAERQRIVADQRLIVALGIGDGGLAPPPVGEHTPQLAKIPILVALVLEQLDPVIGHAHRKPMGETHPTLGDRPAQPRHAGHVLGHQQHAGFQTPRQRRGQLQVEDRILIGIAAEVVVVAAKGPVTTRMVQHRRDTIEPEAVEAEFLKPVAHVRQQEPPHLGPAVIEALGIPLRVVAARAFVKVLMP